MKISLNSALDLASRFKTSSTLLKGSVDELVEKIGSQLGEVEEVVDFGSKFAGVVVVKVVERAKHPDADKLSLCRVDDGGKTKDVERGEDGLVQVVCGAPNVREGMIAAWLPPGSTVPSTYDTEPVVLEARELRGKISNGMLASPKELGVGDTHDGLLELDNELTPGVMFDETYNLRGDVIIDIENKMFTHRPDCFGTLGVTRELAGIQGIGFTSPKWYTARPAIPDIDGEELPLNVVNELPDLVPRFTAITMSQVKVGPSPVWLQIELAKTGQKSINNIVDYANYFMLESGQPLHAYDYDKIKALSGATPTIVVRNPHSEEKVKLLNGKEITPRREAIMIATDKRLIGIGGIMGGSQTEVDEHTTNIVIECGSFDMYSIRRTSMEHGLFTDAVTRFTKGQSPMQNLAVQSRIISEIREYAGGKVAGKMIDNNHLSESALERNSIHPEITIGPEFINDRLGLDLSVKEISAILQNVEFEVENSIDGITVKAPFWRTDIELREDIVEEVGRLYGFDKLPLALPKKDLTPALRSHILGLKSDIRNSLSKVGANEVLTYSFVHGDLLRKVGQNPEQAFEISNALSPDLQYYRISIVPSLLDKVHANIKTGYNQFALFEIGKTHGLAHQEDEDGLPREFEFTGLVVAAADKLKKSGSAYYDARKYLEELTGGDIQFDEIGKDMQEFDVVQPYNLERSALVRVKSTGLFMGIIGEFKPGVIRSFKLPHYCAGFEVDTSVLGDALNKSKSYTTLPKFPKVSQDITLVSPAELKYQELFDFVYAEIKSDKPDHSMFTLIPVDIFQKQEDESHKNITLRLTIASYIKTLTDSEVNGILEKAAASAKSKYSTERA